MNKKNSNNNNRDEDDPSYSRDIALILHHIYFYFHCDEVVENRNEGTRGAPPVHQYAEHKTASRNTTHTHTQTHLNDRLFFFRSLVGQQHTSNSQDPVEISNVPKTANRPNAIMYRHSSNYLIKRKMQ